MTDENMSDVRKEKELKDGETDIAIKIREIMDKMMKERIKYFPVFNKYRNKNRRRRKQKYYRLDYENILEAEIINRRKEELNKALRAF